MKIIVLEGDDIQKSYLRLTKFIETAKSRGWEIIYDDVAVTSSLFEIERLIIIKDYKIITKRVLNSILRIPGTLVIYIEGFLPQQFIKILPDDFKLEKYELPKIIWRFLENPSIKLFHEVLKKEPIELVFNLISKQVRDLYWVKIDSHPKNIPAWKINKLKIQANKYTEIELINLINKLSEIDIKSKTGISDLSVSLDLQLIKNIK